MEIAESFIVTIVLFKIRLLSFCTIIPVPKLPILIILFSQLEFSDALIPKDDPLLSLISLLEIVMFLPIVSIPVWIG